MKFWLLFALLLLSFDSVVFAKDQTDKTSNIAKPAKPNSKTSVSPIKSKALSKYERILLNKKYKKKMKNGPKRYDKPKAAMQFYVDQRVVPGLSIVPVELYSFAREHMKSMGRVNSSMGSQFLSPSSMPANDPLSTEATFNGWDQLGPGNIGGRTRTMVIDPTTPSTMYAAGVAGGIWKTTDSGANWSPLDDLMNNMAVTTLYMDPKDVNTLFAGTGEGFFNGDAVRGDGIFKTTDGGQTWTHLTNTSGNPDFYYVSKVVVSPNDSNRIYAATRSGIWRSIDGGSNWSSVHSHGDFGAANSRCLDIQIRTDITSADTLFASCGSFSSVAGTVYRSVDGGDNWAEVLNEANMGRTTIAIAPSNQNTVYALATSNESGNFSQGLLGVYKSTDGGTSWNATVTNTDSNKLNTVLLSNPVFAFLEDCVFGGVDQYFNQGWYDNIIAVDPADENIVWAGGIDLFRSNDGGQNWGLASRWWTDPGNDDYAHADQHGIYFDPNYNGTTNQVMYVSNDGGISKTSNARAAVDTTADAACNTTDSQINWELLNNYYAVTQFYHGLPYPSGDTYFGGTQDNGTIRGNDTDGINTWVEIFGGDGGYVAVDPANTDILFSETTNLSIRKSTDGGETFSSAINGITESSGNFLFINPFIMDQNDAQKLWTGGRTLWRTDDQAANWVQASTTNMSSSPISAWAVTLGNSDKVFAGNTSGDIFYSSAAGSAGSTTTWSSTRPINGYVSSLAGDPNNANIFYATYSSFGVDHIWKSTDSGASWSAIDSRGQANGIPDIPVHIIAIDPDDSSRLFAGTDLGIFVSLDGGTTWKVENVGFTNTVVENLEFVKTGTKKYLFAFTHGRGAWRTDLSATANSIPVANADSYTVAEDGTLSEAAAGVLGNDTDVDSGTTLTASKVTDPANGTLNLSADGSFTYTPNANFNGSDSFTYIANDGTVDSAPATVTITVTAVNDTPVAVNDSYTVAEDGTLTEAVAGVLGNDTDVDSGTTLTASKVTDPANGTLNLSADGSFTYTPNANFNGSDRFTYIANDGTADSDPATVAITVTAVNDAPVAIDDSYSTDGDTPLQLTSNSVLDNDSDAEGQSLTAIKLTDPVNGTVSISADGLINYTPNTNFDGTDSFTYQASDGVSGSNAATVTININPNSDAVPDSFSFPGGRRVSVATSATIESNPVTVLGISKAIPISVTGGEYNINGGSFTSESGAVVLGDIVRVQHMSSANYSTETISTLTLGQDPRQVIANFSSFTTGENDDLDGDGVVNSEDDEPNSSSVANITDSDGTKVGIIVNNDIQLVNVASVSQSIIDSNSLPNNTRILEGGVIEFGATNIGGNSTVSLEFPADVPANAEVYSVSDTGLLQLFSESATPANSNLTLALVDGGSSDIDGLVNGIVQSRIVVLVAKSEQIVETDSGGGSLDLLILSSLLIISLLSRKKLAQKVPMMAGQSLKPSKEIRHKGGLSEFHYAQAPEQTSGVSRIT